VAEGVVDALDLDIPLTFYGHSFGALVAFEAAHVLRARGGPLPLALMVSGRRAPRCSDSESPICHLSDADFLAAVNSRYGGIPLAVRRDQELMSLLLPALRADMGLTEGYEYTPRGPLEVPILAFGGREDQRVDQAELAAWGQETTGRFDVEMVSGGHFFHLEKRRYLLRCMEDWLMGLADGAAG
jgi:medium-chain acyl-[acyl-carrier-protein] hydrolase